MKVGDIVIVVDCESLPSDYLGRYGKITKLYDFKVAVEFYHRVGNLGSMCHTAYESDLKKIGVAIEE